MSQTEHIEPPKPIDAPAIPVMAETLEQSFDHSLDEEQFGEEEIELESDETEEESISSDKEELKPKESIIIISSDSEATEEEDIFADLDLLEPSVQKKPQKKRKEEDEFFAYILRLPDIDQLSIDESVKRELAVAAGIYEAPLEVIEEIRPDEEEEEEEEAEAPPGTESIESSSTTEISEFEFDFSSSEEEEEGAAQKKVSDDQLFDALVALETQEAVIIEGPDIEELMRLAEERQLREETAAFLDELVECVVEAAEYIDPKEVLRENLDKKRLFRKLIYDLEKLQQERKISDYINRQIVTYYKRLKSMRPFAPEIEEHLAEDLRKFNEAIDHLNSVMGREKATNDIVSKQVDDLEGEAARIQDILDQEITDLDNLMRKTIAKRGGERLVFSVERRIKEMASLRLEISSARNLLIQRQHTMARLEEKRSALENLGDGLHLRDYEAMQNECFALGKKLEDTTFKMNRVRSSFINHTHTLGHVSDKLSMLHHLNLSRKQELSEASEEKRLLREYIHRLKISHVHMKKQIQELSFQSGLKDKPALCLDFDHTTDRINKLRIENKEMKAEATRLNGILDAIAKMG